MTFIYYIFSSFWKFTGFTLILVIILETIKSIIFRFLMSLEIKKYGYNNCFNIEKED